MNYMYLFDSNNKCTSITSTSNDQKEIDFILDNNTYTNYALHNEYINIDTAVYVDGIVDSVKVDVDLELVTKLAQANGYLNSTDWYFARQLETGKSVPFEIIEQRRIYREFIQNNAS